MKLNLSQRFLDSLKDEPEDMWCPHGFMVGCPDCIEELREANKKAKKDDKSSPL